MTTTPTITSTAYVLQRWDSAARSYAGSAPDGTYPGLAAAIVDASARRSAGTLEGRFRVLNLATGAVELEWLR